MDAASPLAAFLRGSSRNSPAPREQGARRNSERGHALEAAPLLSAELPFPVGRLEMEVLQIVAGPPPTRALAQNFVVRLALAAPVNFGKILEEKPRAVKPRP